MMKFKHRYKIAPQMKEYDELGIIWLPYIMYFHTANYSSESVNTDSRGFRVVYKDQRKIANFENTQGSPVNLIVGGSTAFGIGATNDRKTIPSILNSNSDSLWLNFGGRAFGSTQEYILFMLYHQQLQNIKKIIIFSGINNLILYYLSREYPKEIGSFFHLNQYLQTMNYPRISLKRRIIKTLLKPIYGNKVDYSRISKGDLIELFIANKQVKKNVFAKNKHTSIFKTIADHDEEKDDLLFVLNRDIQNWKIISKALQVELYYVLQPLAGWTNKNLSPEEEVLFAELDKHQDRNVQILQNNMDHVQYLWFLKKIRKICENNEVPFVDINDELSNFEIGRKWLFVDRIHLTDKGYELVAEILREKILK